MALPNPAPITLLQIQGEYGTSGLAASSTAAGLDPLPTSMLDFLGRSAVTVYSYFDNLTGQWYITTQSTSSPASSIGTIFFDRSGTYSLVIYGEQYTLPLGTSYNSGPYYNATIASGNWASPTSSTVGDNFWIRFRGTYNVDSPGARIDGYNNSSGVAAPLIAQSSAGNINFNSGWLSLNTNRAIAINSGGDSSGSEGRLFNMIIEISSDSAGSTILSTTSGIAITASTSYTGGGGGGFPS
jgi:hypothetical protein